MQPRRPLLAAPLLLALAVTAGHAQAPAPPSAPPGITLPTQCLVLPSLARGGRSAIHTDPVEYQIVTGEWTAPTADRPVRRPDGSTVFWRSVPATADGVYRAPGLSGGYAYVPVEASRAETVILDGGGWGMAYVNGEPRVGDVYGTGWVQLPVRLKAGHNELLFQGGRAGELKVRLTRPSAPALFNTRDLTLPDLRAGTSGLLTGAVIVLNATEAPLTGLAIETSRPGTAAARTPVPVIPPLSFRKVPFHFDRRVVGGADKATVQLRLRRSTQVLDQASITVRVRKPDQPYKRTFTSEIDGSVQYYAVNPARGPQLPGVRPALVLSLHGASVEAIGQAEADEGKSWAQIVAPTNRRPYGFDWEDWGRLDALEVLAQAQRDLGTDPRRVYLTGHSMGGHGTWQIGATFPDRFAAIAPSAGWISFFTYPPRRTASTPDDPAGELLRRASAPSDTLTLLHNYLQEGVYVLHGDADDNVPVTEARRMRDELSKIHHDLGYHEQPGAGHWWDASDEPGADCVDWPPIFDLFARRALPLPGSLRELEFTTADPGVSSRCHWLEIQAQTHRLQPSTVKIRWDPGKRRFVGSSVNVRRLALRLEALCDPGPVTVELDGQAVPNVAYRKGDSSIYLRREGAEWSAAGPLPDAELTPARCGPFKAAFNHWMLLVYGTAGTAEENRWSYAKARYDAESWWYRGNGAVDVISDREFAAAREPDRSVILYGSADTNAVWKPLLAGSPVQARRGRLEIGGHALAGDDLMCLFVRPRPGSKTASVGVVSGTGLRGFRLTDRQSYFTSGAGYPDLLAAEPGTLLSGLPGVRAAGFFGPEWGVDSGEFQFRAAVLAP